MDTATNHREHIGTSAMKVLGILLLILSVAFSIVAANTKPAPVRIKYGTQNFQETVHVRFFYFALSGTSLLAGIVLTTVSIAMEKIMKQNRDIRAAIKQLSTSVVYMRLIDKRQADRRQHNIPVEEERRQANRRTEEKRLDMDKREVQAVCQSCG